MKTSKAPKSKTPRTCSETRYRVLRQRLLCCETRILRQKRASCSETDHCALRHVSTVFSNTKSRVLRHRDMCSEARNTVLSNTHSPYSFFTPGSYEARTNKIYKLKNLWNFCPIVLSEENGAERR